MSTLQSPNVDGLLRAYAALSSSQRSIVPKIVDRRYWFNKPSELDGYKRVIRFLEGGSNLRDPFRG